ncbi:helix-turn-helix domain-containing protein [Sphingomonas sp.]|uniref:helix-turn-helix domain-containing protein n=1 Tax=Sphingomonas sp. TaxID=28214 RepID=UPI003BABA331
MIPRLSSFSARLRAARKDLGLDQAAFGALAGVQRTAQSNYEKGDRSPDVDYLLRISEAGVDIVELLTGIPSQTPEFEAWELETLARLRAIPAEQRHAINTILRALVGEAQPLINLTVHSGRTSFAQDGDKR